MELSKERIREMSAEEIYKSVGMTVRRALDKSRFQGVSREVLEIVAKEVIEATKELYDGREPYARYIQKQVEVVLAHRMKSVFESDEKTFDFLNSYISQCKDMEPELLLKKLKNLFHSYNYCLTPDIIFKLIRDNNTFSKMTDIIYEKYAKTIELGKMEKYITNELTISVLEAYCAIHNIDIPEPAEEEEDSYED